MSHVVCIGAGPAGLTAAYLLAKSGDAVTVLERDAHYVGGISRTVHYKGFGFDIGGHRFFSKSPEVTALWNEIIGDDFLERPRKSRIYYNGHFYPYPLEAWATFKNLGMVESALCVLSYVRSRLRPRKPVKSVEDWVINRFGLRLYRTFFKTYTEKVWGMPCSAISADWAAQRIKGLSLSKAVWNALRPQRRNVSADKVVKTLINTFHYPRRGPGMMWEKAAKKTVEWGGMVRMGAEVIALTRLPEGWEVHFRDKDGKSQAIQASHVVSSMPLSQLIQCISPALPKEAITAARALTYRDFLIVALVVQDRKRFDDNWIYIHDPSVKVGRIQNFKSWSPDMVPDQSLNCYGMEYFCFAGDGLWNSADEKLVQLASAELVKLGLAQTDEIVEGVVVRQPKAYPVYDEHYEANVMAVRKAIERHCPNLHVVGRAGMHKYNNQDHAMMTAMLTVENIKAGKPRYDVWNVNQDAEYHEGSNAAASGLRLQPSPVRD